MDYDSKDIITSWQTDIKNIRSDNKDLYSKHAALDVRLRTFENQLTNMESFKFEVVSKLGEFDHLHTRVDNHRNEFKRDINDLRNLIIENQKASSNKHDMMIRKFDEFSSNIGEKFSTLKKERDQLAGAWVLAKFLGGGSIVMGMIYGFLNMFKNGL